MVGWGRASVGEQSQPCSVVVPVLSRPGNQARTLSCSQQAEALGASGRGPGAREGTWVCSVLGQLHLSPPHAPTSHQNAAIPETC